MVLTEVLEHQIIPVVVLNDADKAQVVGESLVKGGLPVAEVTFRTAAAPGAIRILAERGDMLVGAGTVIRADQVDEAADAGAKFIVSPGSSLGVIRRCFELGLPVIPGAVTATEVMTLLDQGISLVKFFPAQSSGGPAAISALASPFGQVQFVPTGGVSSDNIAQYLALDCVPAVGGSWMLPGKLVEAGRVDALVELCRRAVELVGGEH